MQNVASNDTQDPAKRNKAIARPPKKKISEI